jgi:hypothetical protein
MNIAHCHLDASVSEQTGEHRQVHARHDSPRCVRVPKIVKSESGRYFGPAYCRIVCFSNAADRSLGVVGRREYVYRFCGGPPLSRAHAPPHTDAAPGLEVASRATTPPPAAWSFAFSLSPAPSAVLLDPASAPAFLPPAMVRLYGDLDFFADWWGSYAPGTREG